MSAPELSRCRCGHADERHVGSGLVRRGVCVAPGCACESFEAVSGPAIPTCPYRTPRCPAKPCVPCRIEEDERRRAEHAARVEAGLDDARATLAEIWRRHSAAGNDALRDRAWSALGAVIEAQTAMRAADAYVADPRPATREALRTACVLRATPKRLRKP